MLTNPAIFDAFQASRSMKAAPKVPERKLAAKSAPLLCGIPLGSNPIMIAAARMVGMMQINITVLRSLHLSESHPDPRTKIAPIAPDGMDMSSASLALYPNETRRIELKLLMPPLGMDESMVQRQTIQTRMSFKVSKICFGFNLEFCVPD